MKKSILVAFVLFSLVCNGQKTWWGDYSFFAGGGQNDIFRFNELVGAASFTGKGYWTAGVDLRRIITDHFSIETGLGYSHHYYIMESAPVPETFETPGNFGVMTIPLTARLDFLKFFFADAGIVAGFQTGFSDADNMTGLGLTAGLGVEYVFKSDIFIAARLYSVQHALLHFLPEDYPQTMYSSGVTISVGYQFIRLGKCNCPDDRSPKKRIF